LQDELDEKQAELISGTNIRTVAGTSVLGSGDIPIDEYTDADALSLFNASGSAPVYACRAWVNFNGTGTVAIRASGNVSSITDNGTGMYTVNFTTAMPDGNYAVNGVCGTTVGGTSAAWVSNGSSAGSFYVNNTTSSCRVVTNYNSLSFTDYTHISVSIFR